MLNQPKRNGTDGRDRYCHMWPSCHRSEASRRAAGINGATEPVAPSSSSVCSASAGTGLPALTNTRCNRAGSNRPRPG